MQESLLLVSYMLFCVTGLKCEIGKITTVLLSFGMVLDTFLLKKTKQKNKTNQNKKEQNKTNKTIQNKTNKPKQTKAKTKQKKERNKQTKNK